MHYIEDYLVNYFTKIDNIIEKLVQHQSAPLEEQSKYRDIGYYLQILKGNNLSILKDLFEFLVKTNKPFVDKKIDEIFKSIPKFELSLIDVLKEFGPNNGIEIAKGSFNYYILNKSPKQYFELEISKLKLEFSKTIHQINLDYIFNIKFGNINQNVNYTLDDSFFNKIGLNLSNLKNMTMLELYDEIKLFKAKRKSAFIQFVGNGYTYEDLISKTTFQFKYFIKSEEFIEELSVELFDDIGETNFEYFKNLTDQINGLGKEINNILQPLNKSRKDYEREINKKTPEFRTELENRFIEISKEIKNKAEERGKYFNIPNEKILTQNYKLLCEFYKNIALKIGQNKAKILGYQKQIIDSEKLKFYAIIIENGNNKELALIPKGGQNYHQLAHDFLNDQRNSNPDGSIKIHSFKSLTLRALQKLCFKEDKEVLLGEVITNQNSRNTFIKNIIAELSNNQVNKDKKYFHMSKKMKIELKRFDEFKINDRNQYKTNGQLDEKLLIEFYKDVLNTDVAKDVLDINDFGLDSILSQTHNSLDEFEIDLEKVAYTKNLMMLDEISYKKFIESLNVFIYKITSQDLSIDIKDHINKAHTKYWLDFWTKDNQEKYYDIRINPEFSLYYKLSDDDLVNKQKEGLLEKPQKLDKYRNRRLDKQLLFTTNFSLNSNNKKYNLAFKDTQDLKENVGKFNENLETEINSKYKSNEIRYFGIDRGINELATLSITKFLDSKNQYNVNNFEFAKIEFWKLIDKYDKIIDIKVVDGVTKYEFEKAPFTKDGHTRNFEVSKNISYFLSQKDYFKRIETGIIDLTQAKLIGDKIVLNGDKSTYIKLKEVSAKRRLYELYSKGKINKDSKIEIKPKVLFVVDNDNNEHTIYRLSQEFKADQKYGLKEKIQKILLDFIFSLDDNNKFEDVETISKINHLRDAITSNMVGILYYLIFKQGYFGKIILENLDENRSQKEQIKDGKYTGDIEKMIDGHFYQSNTDISRRLEWSLYKKFQGTSFNGIGLVPPDIKQSIILKDNFGINKFGIIEFVKVGGTSSICPYCNSNFMSKDGLKKHHNNDNCGFNNQSGVYFEFYQDIKSGNSINYDSIGAYNVAKNGYLKILSKSNNSLKKYKEINKPQNKKIDGKNKSEGTYNPFDHLKIN
ncbi:MAG: hypothetical protein V3575_03875 [Candidatus Absconditabacteria bacterium]